MTAICAFVQIAGRNLFSTNLISGALAPFDLVTIVIYNDVLIVSLHPFLLCTILII